MSHYILKDGQIGEVGLMEWAEWFETASKRQIDYTTIGAGIYVSTVFLGIDMDITGKGPPLIFETMVFGLDDDDESWTERHATLGEAKHRHHRAVEWARKQMEKVTR